MLKEKNEKKSCFYNKSDYSIIIIRFIQLFFFLSNKYIYALSITKIEILHTKKINQFTTMSTEQTKSNNSALYTHHGIFFWGVGHQMVFSFPLQTKFGLDQFQSQH
jgi:hypothetical protein